VSKPANKQDLITAAYLGDFPETKKVGAMNNQTELQKVSDETMRFMRGKYVADEVGDGKDELKFRRGGKTILTIYIRENNFEFLVIYGKAEREKFEARRSAFPQKIQDIYDNSKTYHDGKWMLIPIADLETLEAVKELILIKKNPTRKPFPKDNAIVGDCGHRCDLCVHYTGGTISEGFRNELRQRLERVYKSGHWGDDMMLCPGCHNQPDSDPCHQKKCAVSKGAAKCMACCEYPCTNALAGLRGKITANSVLADDVTWAILPYVHEQYGN